MTVIFFFSHYKSTENETYPAATQAIHPSIQECAPALVHFQVGTGNELHVNMADPCITT